MARVFACLLLAWALLLGPALCVGGLIEHTCACENESDAGCEHEESCPDDPCASVVRLEERDAQAELEVACWQTPLAPDTLGAELGIAKCSWRLKPFLPPDRGNLPYPQSDRPQLI